MFQSPPRVLLGIAGFLTLASFADGSSSMTSVPHGGSGSSAAPAGAAPAAPTGAPMFAAPPPGPIVCGDGTCSWPQEVAVNCPQDCGCPKLEDTKVPKQVLASPFLGADLTTGQEIYALTPRVGILSLYIPTQHPLNTPDAIGGLAGMALMRVEGGYLTPQDAFSA